MPQLAQRLSNVQVSPSAAMTAKAREMRAKGINVISLANGEPDFASPRHAIEAAYQAALAGDTKYPPQGGTPALKAAARIVSVESRHAAWIRDLRGMNPAPTAAEPAIDAQRVIDTLKGSGYVR